MGVKSLSTEELKQHAQEELRAFSEGYLLTCLKLKPKPNATPYGYKETTLGKPYPVYLIKDCFPLNISSRSKRAKAILDRWVSSVNGAKQ